MQALLKESRKEEKMCDTHCSTLPDALGQGAFVDFRQSLRISAVIDLTRLASVKPELLFLSHILICWHLSKTLVTINVCLLLLKSIFQGLRTKD